MQPELGRGPMKSSILIHLSLGRQRTMTARERGEYCKIVSETCSSRFDTVDTTLQKIALFISASM